MSIRQMTVAWKARCQTHTQKLVLLALADNASDEGECWPSVTTLAEKCDLSRQSVIDQIHDFEGMGWLRVIRGHGRSNRYRLSIPVNDFDQSTGTTSQPPLPPVVNGIDHHQSTRLTTPVNAVDPNRQEPSGESSKEPPRTVAKKATILKPESNPIAIPPQLAGEDFEKAWHEWADYRRQMKLKAYLPIGAQKLLAELSAIGKDRAIAAINHSIAQGWQGIHEPKSINGKPAPAPTIKPTDPAGWREYLATLKPPIEYKEYRYASDWMKTEFNGGAK